MKAFFSMFILPCCLAGLLIGCNTSLKQNSDNIIQFDSLLVTQTYHFFEVDTNPQCSIQLNFVYPVYFADKDILRLIQQQFVSGFWGEEYDSLMPEEAAEKYVDNFIRNYKEEEKNFQLDMENHETELDESWYSIEETLTNQIVYNRNDIISFTVYKEGYYGGAHGFHNYDNRVIDLKTGLRITEDDIFTGDYQDDLAKIIVDAIALSNNVEIAELENIGFFNVGEIYPNRNFFADEKGLTYTYNEYEIAAYVVGPVSVHIPYDNIRHLLRRTSPIAAITF